MFKFLILPIAIFIYISLPAQVVIPEWSRFQSYEDAGQIGEYPFSLTDGANNVYVCGGTYHPGPLIGMITSKYDANGELLWDAKFSTNAQDIMKSAVVDIEGNIYVAGNTKNPVTNLSQFVVFKYDGISGEVLWEYRYESSTPGDRSSISKLLLLENQQLIICGRLSNNSTLQSELLTISLNNAGSVIWSYTYENPTGGSSALSAKIVEDGSIVIWGISATSSNTNGFLCLVLNGNGELISINLSETYLDVFYYGFHIDHKGNLFIGDFVGDYKVSKFNLKAELEWSYSKPSIPPPTPAFPGARLFSIQTDSLDNVYIGGTYYTDSIIGKNQYVTMLDQTGSMIWEHIFMLDTIYKGVETDRASITDNGLIVFAGTYPIDLTLGHYRPYIAYYNQSGYLSGGFCEISGNINIVTALFCKENYLYLTGGSYPDSPQEGEIKQYVSKIAVPIVSSTHTSSSTLLPLEIFPNPGHGAISATFDYQGKQRSGVVDVVNTEGRVISSQLFLAEQGKNQVALRCAEVLPAGIYSVVLRLGTDIYSGKLIKN